MEQPVHKSTFATVIVMISTAVSRLFGFVRIALIGAVFGASGTADVLNAVFTIPNNLRKLMAEGALSSAFIPVLAKSIVQDATGLRARKILRLILSFQFLVLVPVLLVCVIFSPTLIRFILDFQDPHRIALASDLFRWMIHYLLLVSISAVFMGVINAHSSFLVPAITPILFSVAVISSVLLLYRILGPFSMVVGVLAGGLAQVLFQIPKMRSLGYDFKPAVDFRNPDFVKVMRLWLPVVATSSVYTINEQIAIFFATGLEDGSVSAMSNALVFWQLPFGVFSASITTVLFPRMSRQAGAGDTDGLKTTLEYGLRYLILLLVPSAIVISFLAKEIIAVALQRGNFLPENTLLTARVLIAYNIGLLPVGAFNFFQRYFYARDNYKTPLATAFFACILDIILSLVLKETPLRVAGLALANSAAFSAGLALMWLRARASLKPRAAGVSGAGEGAPAVGGNLSFLPVFITLGKSLAASLPAAVFLYVFLKYTGSWWQNGSTFLNMGFLSLAAAVSGVIIFIMYRSMKIDILMSILRREVK
ncbi:MAG: murein biosynthesis integral membrane protein MurJ [Spirochaetales bacterium]|jgi:putative peptidoglycan lipid II flippase|nr:murein biosynthesis integral membrane protein MurJ [Spirochaetales bacterium]